MYKRYYHSQSFQNRNAFPCAEGAARGLAEAPYGSCEKRKVAKFAAASAAQKGSPCPQVPVRTVFCAASAL